MNSLTPLQENVIRELAAIAVAAYQDKPRAEVIRLYERISLVLPTDTECLAAERVAFNLKEADQQQLKFLSLLHNSAAAEVQGDGARRGA